MAFEPTKEQEAMIRWMGFQFFEAERDYAKAWREQLAAINFHDRVERAKACIGNLWRDPTSLDDARRLTNVIINNVDPVRLLAYGLDFYGLSARKIAIIAEWINSGRLPIRERFPQLVHMLSVDICFSLLWPTRMLRNVKESHVVDIAYLYYLPYCSVFTSKDDFHAQFAPLFLWNDQEFVNGDALKAACPVLRLHAHDQYLFLPSLADAAIAKRQAKSHGRSCLSLLPAMLARSTSKCDPKVGLPWRLHAASGIRH